MVDRNARTLGLLRFAILACTLSAVACLGVACAADSGPPFGDTDEGGGGDEGGIVVVDGGLDAGNTPLDGSSSDAPVVGDASNVGAPDAGATDTGGVEPPDATTADANTLDGSVSDTSAPDTGSTPDASTPDTSAPDASLPDTSIPDASPPDTSPPPDASTPDTSIPDTSAPDTSLPDTSAPDTSTPDAGGCLANIPATCPDCMTQNASDKPTCEKYIACYLAENCNPSDACGSNDGVCGVNTIGGGTAPETAAIVTYNCACP